MWSHLATDSELDRAYRAELAERRMPDAVRTAARIVFVLNMAFVALDAYAYPDKFGEFFAARMALNVVLAGLYFFGSRRFPVASQYLLCLATGSLLLGVIYGAGAPVGEYYVGLVLAAVGLPVLLPMGPLQVAGVWSIFVVGFAASPLFVEVTAWKTYVIHTVFLASGAFTGAASAAFMESARVRDFAQRREIEAARDHLKEMDRVKSRFTANLHHELRTPLTLILAPLEAILSESLRELPDGVPAHLKSMHVNGLRLLNLINNLLDLAKVEARRYELHRREVDAAGIMEDIVAGATPLAARKRIELSLRCEGELPTVFLDRDAFEKIAVNLVGNALKFTEQGGRVECSLGAEDGGLHLIVSDSGIGLAPEQLERVFDRFAQVDASSTRKQEGTGIGLSLVRELAELHGGRAWAESEGLGHGARLHVVVPKGEADALDAEEALANDDGSTVSARRANGALAADVELPDAEPLVELERSVSRWENAEGGASGGVPAARGPRVHVPEILVAEDNQDMRRLFASLLGRDHRVRLTANGREALEAVRERAPDLVLSDVMMPEMSGTDLCRALKSDPATQAIPVVLVTSKAERAMRIEGLELGADDYVAKPFHPRELLARVRSLLRVRGLQTELAKRNERLEGALTELQTTQSQLVESERLAAVGGLAAGVAHEANNPINFALTAARALGGSVKDLHEVGRRIMEIDWEAPDSAREALTVIRDLLEQLDVDEAVAGIAELVEIVEEGLQRTGRLIGDLRDFAGPRTDQRVRADLRQHLLSTIALIRPALREKSVAIETRFDDGLSAVVVHTGSINQVFLNLLKNALDVLSEGGSIEVRARNEDGRVVVEIVDDGPGIDPGVRERLFDPFVTTKGGDRGSGLGLSISRRIVNEHGGTLDLVDGAAGGAVARISLPNEETIALLEDAAAVGA